MHGSCQICAVKRLLFLLVGLVGLPAMGVSQDAIADSPVIERKRFISNVIFQLDNRNERYYGVGARMNGIRLGIEIEKTLRVGFGLYQNNNYYSFEPPSANDSLQQTIQLNYSNIFMEWILYEDFRWELSMPLSYGGGNIRLNNFARVNGLPEFVGSDTIDRARLIDLGLMGHVKVFPWFGVGAGVGYRQMLSLDPLYRKPFSAPYIDFKVKLFLGYIYKGIFKPEVVQEERDAYMAERAARKAKR